MAGATPRIDRLGARLPCVPSASNPERDAPASLSAPFWSDLARLVSARPRTGFPRPDDGDWTRPPPHPAPDCPTPSHPDPRMGAGPFLPRDPPTAEAGAAIRCLPQRNSPGVWNQWADPEQDLS
ncbi:hypothetical protein MASR2M74_22750 [Paracoccaceae bacterium]